MSEINRLRRRKGRISCCCCLFWSVHGGSDKVDGGGEESVGRDDGLTSGFMKSEVPDRHLEQE